MWCCVCDCSNNSDKGNIINEFGKLLSYHTFPKNGSLLKSWVFFCKRKDKFNTATARICSEHFLPEDYANYLQYDLGLADKLLLKKGAIPSIYSSKCLAKDKVVDSDRTQRMSTKRSKKIISELLINNTEPNSTFVEAEAEEEIELISKNGSADIHTELKNIQVENNELKIELESIKRRFKENDEKYKEEIVALKSELQKSEFHRKNMENKLLEIFTPGQVRKLQNSWKRLTWTEADVARSIALYSASPRAYQLLRRKKFPLPCVRTLNTWAQKLDISTGIIDPVIKIMAAATHLTEAQKVCVLSFDEMKVKEKFCYDRCSDTIYKPAKYAQVALLRGLVHKWKQPIFYNFDCKMTKNIIFNIIETAKDCGYTIVAITSDLGGGNRGLYKELNIQFDKPWFNFGNNKIYVFA